MLNNKSYYNYSQYKLKIEVLAFPKKAKRYNISSDKNQQVFMKKCLQVIG